MKTYFSPRLLGFPLAMILPAAGLAQTPADVAARLSATTETATPAITLHWPPALQPGGAIQLTRIERDTGNTADFSVPAAAVSFTDNSIVSGRAYEYAFSQDLSAPSGMIFKRRGTIQAAIDRPLFELRGRVLVLVDETLAPALTDELAQFTDDLFRDGWTVVRRDLPRAAVSPADNRAAVGALRLAEVQAVKQVVRDFHGESPADSRAVVLIGHLPVPYSGQQAPDGHPDHLGAWPADAYYGELTHQWTDLHCNLTQTAPRQVNVPGDGKFDQSVLPSPPELSVGRIDFSDLPASSLSETALIRQYLQRNHAYRNRLAPFDQVGRGLLVDDHFGFSHGEAFAAMGWNTGTALFGPENVQPGDWFSVLEQDACLMAYGCGGGSFQGVSGVGSSADFAQRPSKAVFNLLFGSYFGDWDNPDNVLRAAIGGPAGSLGLVSLWVNRPDWNLAPLALGDTIGDTMIPANGSAVPVFRAILGDPTLRLDHVPEAPGALSAVATQAGLALSWGAFPGPATGYHVFRAEHPAGPFARLSGETPLAVTGFTDTALDPGVVYHYQVRAVVREHNASGSYLHLSAPAVVQAVADTAPLRVVSAVSRRIHDGAGCVDIPLGRQSIEPRTLDGNLELVVRFNQPLAEAAVALTGAASLRETRLSDCELSVIVGGAASPQWLTLHLTACVGAAGGEPLAQDFSLGLLPGDVNRDGMVNMLDARLIQRASGSASTPDQALCDLNADGWISQHDVKTLAKCHGQFLPGWGTPAWSRNRW